MNPNSLCDTHFHLDSTDDVDSIVQKAHDAGVENLILSCCDLSSIEFGINIVNKYPNMYLTIGLHPDEIKDDTSDLINYFEDLIINNPKIIGIGEIGLDYYHNKDNKEEQIALFKKQLDLAKKLNLPVVIHSRDAFLDTYNILKEYKLKTTIHCFTGSMEVANLYIKEGYLLGIGGVSTFKNTNLKETLKSVPLENIVFETDSPYMAPEPFRGTKNEPSNVSIICDNLCNIKNISRSDAIKITTKNVLNQYSRIKR
ncbi:MAG: TatD family hydrolase [Bacilli bacterium]|nr:TatD family hydrolase [Bacilli bacterium]